MSAATPPPSSPLDAALARVGDRWTLLIVNALLGGPRRFGDLQAEVKGIAPNVLTQRLRHLEREGVLIAEAYSSRPPRAVYRLTAAGEDLAGALRLLAYWGAGRADGASSSEYEAETPRHRPCATPLEARWWCPTCEVAIADPATIEIRYV